ncbi:hypothetical protein ACFOY2_12605 [Nonomuraea purpurea]|uniref:Uncharacterized protein n=1 Tax=Nonomuraea purpurea TaxID=1849276 RepID=A0ABV8G6W6_9ACTN
MPFIVTTGAIGRVARQRTFVDAGVPTLTGRPARAFEELLAA